MYYIYILYSQSSDRYYVGYTHNYQQRLHQHNNSERTTYTSKHRPWMLAAVYECSESEGETVRIERWIKRQKKRSLIEALERAENLPET